MKIAVIIGEVAYISRSRIMDGIVDSAKKDNVNVVLFTCEGFLFHELKDYSAGEYNIFNLPALETFDGIIVELDSVQNQKMKEMLRDNISKTNVPCVSIDQEIEGTNEIYFDNKEGFVKLISHLIEDHGLKDIHYMSGPFGNRDALQRLDIFKQVMSEHGLTVDDANVYEGDFNFGSGRQVAREYIEKGKKLPQAFVAANDFMAIGLMEELKLHGVRVPEDIVITGYDNCDIAEYTVPKLTTVDRGEYEAGTLAYEKLVVDSIGRKKKNTVSVVSGKPVLSGSCGCCSNRSTAKSEQQSTVDLKMHMDGSLDLIKGLTVGLSNMESISEFERCIEKYIQDMGMESFYYCQCGSRESYYEELEILASGDKVKRNLTVYQDMVWCPIAYENGEWNSYPSFSRKHLFPPAAKVKDKGGYYIVMPVHQGTTCIGYCIIGNFDNILSGRVIQHLTLGIGFALGHMRRNDIMSTMLAKINQKWQYDELTGLYNRSGFVNNTKAFIERANAENKGISVIFFDLNGLKIVNDTQGHEAGDKYIASMADMLRSATTEEDIVCRYGGDEYVVLSVQESREASIKKLEHILEKIVEPVSASAGCVFDKVKNEDELNRLIEAADEKMYTYKRESKKSRDN